MFRRRARVHVSTALVLVVLLIVQAATAVPAGVGGPQAGTQQIAVLMPPTGSLGIPSERTGLSIGITGRGHFSSADGCARRIACGCRDAGPQPTPRSVPRARSHPARRRAPAPDDPDPH
jgi:hypothetical protein